MKQKKTAWNPNRIDIENSNLLEQSTAFFKHYGSRKLLGRSLFDQIKKDKDRITFEAFVQACGFEHDISSFFSSLLSGIFEKSQPECRINGIDIPKLYLYDLLETFFPGQRLHRIKSAGNLSQLLTTPPADPDKLNTVIDLYPVRLSDHVVRQSWVSKGVAGQYLPFVEELDPTGESITFDGHSKQGILEQMYENRVILLLDMRCPVYCRFCFRKHKDSRKKQNPRPRDVIEAVEKIKKKSAVSEVLITGGEPLINRPNLETAIAGLKNVDHVRVIRIATRSVAYYPELFLKRNLAYIRYLIRQNEELKPLGKRIEIGVHFVHPDEVSLQSLEIIKTFVHNGIQVYVQTPFLQDLNTGGKTLARLFKLLRNAGAKIYYIFTPCSPIHSTHSYWTTIDQAFEAYQHLQEHLPDRYLPKLCTATPLGKIEWGTSGWAVEQDKADPQFTWIRTPYTQKYFESFVENKDNMPAFRKNDEGTLDARFRICMGAKTSFPGPRKIPKNEKTDVGEWSSRETETIISDPSQVFLGLSPENGIHLIGEHTLEMTVDKKQKALALLSSNKTISDVVLFVEKSNLKRPGSLIDLILRIREISEATWLRLAYPEFKWHPEYLNEDLIEKLLSCMDISIADPFRIEVGTLFFKPEEIKKAHQDAAQQMISKGIHIYADVPLIQGINDRPETITDMAHALRYAEIEFHRLYVDGWNGRTQPISKTAAQNVIDIASMIRSACSGREIPLYMVRTDKGDRCIDLTRQGIAHRIR